MLADVGSCQAYHHDGRFANGNSRADAGAWIRPLAVQMTAQQVLPRYANVREDSAVANARRRLPAWRRRRGAACAVLPDGLKHASESGLPCIRQHNLCRCLAAVERLLCRCLAAAVERLLLAVDGKRGRRVSPSEL